MIQALPPGRSSAVPSIFTNEMFLKTLFGPDWGRVKVTFIAGNPEHQPASVWRGYPAEDMLRAAHAELNTYFSVGVQSGLHRSLAGFETIRVVVVDDVGVKVDLKTAIDLLGTSPTYLLETSPGNCQAGWATEIGSRDYALGLVKALHQALGSDNIKNLVGYMRLPVGTNWKPKCGPGGFRHVMRAWNPDARIDPLGWIEVEKRIGRITPITRRLGSPDPKMPDPGEIEDDAVLKAFRMLGAVQGLGRPMTMGWGFDVDCPWIAEHSERAREGASYVPVQGRFHCHHGHCQDRTMGDVRAKLSELLKAQHGTTLAALEFEDEIDPVFLDGLKTAVGRLPTQDELAEYEQTEDGMGLAFVDRHRDQLRFDQARGCWFHWGGGHWQQDRVKHAWCWALALLREYRRTPPQDATAGWLRSTGKMAFADAIERAARAHLAETGLDWDQDPWIAGAPGCEIDLRLGKVIPPDPDHRVTKQLLVAPDMEMKTPIWDQFLWDSSGGDPEMIGFLQAWAGYCLTGDTREEKFVFIYGPGGNGKSTFLHTMGAILHDYAAQVAVEMFMVRKFDAHPEEIARLHGVRAITTSEVGAGQTFNIGRVKDFTGGDKLTARFMRQGTFNFHPQFKTTFVGNDHPRIPEVDDALRRRLILVPFTQKPVTVDTALKDKLVPEYPGILAWMIEGENRRRTMGGLSALIPSAASQATEAYLDGQDQIKAWAAERCVFGPGEQVGVTDAYEDHKSWCWDQGTSSKVGSKSFSGKFLERFSGCAKREVQKGTVLVGVSLRPQVV